MLPWLDRFAGWHLGAKLMPPTPPPPGVAIKKAAALAEGKDADKAVQEARAKVGSCRTPKPAAQHWACQTETCLLLVMCDSATESMQAASGHAHKPDAAADAVQGELLKLSQLPPPWGPKPYKPSPETAASYQPPAYPQASAPSITA